MDSFANDFQVTGPISILRYCAAVIPEWVSKGVIPQTPFPKSRLVRETGDFYLITIEFKLRASGVVLSPSTLV
ncbi:hypothetical protein P5673_021483 [Acropora cervicornis]|uniref:Uncharacterized protein n=1 Tax=Acropora cervicornis TaxID=6130 RepID=A0AAD9Q928_ACRCE|nr:hypothetical protein P5673_021483 [Acropora cervicornis]